MLCRTKAGTLRVYHEGREYLLDGNGCDLPADLAESIRPHVNVEIVEPEAQASEPKKSRAPKSPES